MTMKMTLLFYTVTMAMVVTVLSLRECEETAVVTFYYKCLGQSVPPCLPGRHLRIGQEECDGEVIRNRICDECRNGYITTHNTCDECNPWTECELGEMEDPSVPPNAQRDRTCIPRTAPTAASVAPSQCPPCNFTVTCPACPDECPMAGSQASSDTEEESTLDTRSSEDATTPGVSVTTGTVPNAKACPSYRCDGETWKSIAIGFAVAFAFLLLVVVLLVVFIICLCRQKKADMPEGLPDQEGGCCNGRDGIRYDKANGTVSGGGIGSGSSGGSNQVHIPAVPSQEQTNALGNGGPSVSEHSPARDSEITHAEESSKPMATPNEYVVDVHNTPTSSGKEAGVTADTGSDVATPKKSPANKPPKSLKVSIKPLVKRDYDVSGGTPSTQPLLATSTLPGDTMATQTATGVYQQSDLDKNVSNHVGDNAESLQSVSPNSNALHEAPTAPYRESPPTSPSYSAFEKAEGQCGTTSHCNEWHADFVKDNIDVATLIDFFVKLGLQKKDFDATMYDNRSERTREQIRHVIINDFIGKEDNPSIYRLLSALDASGNKHVSRMFREKFHVTSSAGC